MANEWMSALPSAWKAPDFGTVAQAAKTGADAALSRQQAVGAAVTAADANQARIRKQALQDAMAKGIRTSVDKNGQIIHVFDRNRFLEGLKTNPAAADAYKMYVETAYPQAGKEAVQQGLSENITAAGGFDASGIAKAAQRSPYGADLVTAAQGLQKQQAGTAMDIATNRAALGTLATPGQAAPGTLVGNEQMQGKDLAGASTDGSGVTPVQIGSLDKTARANVIYKLREVAGIALPPTASDADISAAISQAENANVRASMGQGKIGELPTSVFNTAMNADKIKQETRAKILGGALDFQGKGLDLLGKTQTQDEIDKFKREGYNANTGNVAEVRDVAGQVGWLESTRESVREYKSQVAKGAIDPDTFNNQVNTWLNAPQVAESIGTESGRDKFLSGLRPVKSLGAIISGAPDTKSAISSLFKQRLGAQEQKVVLDQLDNILSEQLISGQAVNKQRALKAGGLEKSKLKSGFDSKLPVITSQAQYEALKPGTRFQDSKGVVGVRKGN